MVSSFWQRKNENKNDNNNNNGSVGRKKKESDLMIAKVVFFLVNSAPAAIL